MDGWMDGHINGCVDGQMDGWREGGREGGMQTLPRLKRDRNALDTTVRCPVLLRACKDTFGVKWVLLCNG